LLIRCDHRPSLLKRLKYNRHRKFILFFCLFVRYGLFVVKLLPWSAISCKSCWHNSWMFINLINDTIRTFAIGCITSCKYATTVRTFEQFFRTVPSGCLTLSTLQIRFNVGVLKKNCPNDWIREKAQTLFLDHWLARMCFCATTKEISMKSRQSFFLAFGCKWARQRFFSSMFAMASNGKNGTGGGLEDNVEALYSDDLNSNPTRFSVPSGRKGWQRDWFWPVFTSYCVLEHNVMLM